MNNKILIVSSNYYENISNELENGAINTLNEHKIEYDIIHAPGCFEIPFIVKQHIDKYKAFITLGCIIKGDTYHFEIIANETARKIMDISSEYLVPIGFGILTCYNIEQAKIRSDTSKKNKGREAALACLELIN